MLVLSFFSWWYGQGWKQAFSSIGPRVSGITEAFSVGQLLKTLFAPWKRITTNPGSSIEQKVRAMIDNLVSRAIGFCVRIGVLIAAGISIVAVIILSVAQIILWPLAPIGVILLPLIGLMA